VLHFKIKNVDNPCCGKIAKAISKGLITSIQPLAYTIAVTAAVIHVAIKL
jgi:hypothetical protein